LRASGELIVAVLLGAAGSLLAAIFLAAFGQSAPVFISVLSISFVLILVHLWSLRKSIRILRFLGIAGWEASMSTGTSTRKCIDSSQLSLSFMGIAANKWLRDKSALRKMLLRHASNGGMAQFLLLDPDSPACSEFESIKGFKSGELSGMIRQNAMDLLAMASEGLPVEVRYFRNEPRFRLVFIDDRRLVLGLYSYLSDSGEDSPQLLLESSAKTDWSFFFGFRGNFINAWRTAKSAF